MPEEGEAIRHQPPRGSDLYGSLWLGRLLGTTIQVIEAQDEDSTSTHCCEILQWHYK